MPYGKIYGTGEPKPSSVGPPQFFPNDLTGPWGSSLIPNGSPGAGLPQPTGPPQSSSSPISPPRPPAPQGMALKPRLQTHSLGTRSLWGPQGLVPQPHSPAAARRRPSFWKAPGGGMQARNHMLPGGAARGSGRGQCTQSPHSPHHHPLSRERRAMSRFSEKVSCPVPDAAPAKASLSPPSWPPPPP